MRSPSLGFSYFPLGASHQGWIDIELSPHWHAIGALGPLVAAFAATSQQGRRELLDSLTRWRGHGWWWALAASPLLLAAPALAVTRIETGAWPNLSSLAESSRLEAGFLVAVLLPALAYGIGEETGWRGFLLPRLSTRFGPWVGTLLLSVVWVLWHIPFYLYRPGFVDASTADRIAQAIVITLAAFFLTWLFRSTGGSILLVAVWHTANSIVHIVVPEVSVSWDTWIGVGTTTMAIIVMLVWRRGLAVAQVDQARVEVPA